MVNFSSPLSIIRRLVKMLPEAYGCVVVNRFGELLDDDADPFDFITEMEMAQEKKKNKKEEEDKKAKKKPGQRESQKDRRLPLASAGPDSVPGELTVWLPFRHTPNTSRPACSASFHIR